MDKLVKLTIGCFLVCFMLVCAGNGKVTAEENNKCEIEVGVKIFARPISGEFYYCITTETTFKIPKGFSGIKLYCISKPLANLLGLEQEEVTHYCYKTKFNEDSDTVTVILTSRFCADINSLIETLTCRGDDIFNGLSEDLGNCELTANPKEIHLFLLDKLTTPEVPKPTETKIKKYKI
jgi:hypothetical protein